MSNLCSLVTPISLATYDHVLNILYHWWFVKSLWWKIYFVRSCSYTEETGYISSNWDGVCFLLILLVVAGCQTVPIFFNQDMTHSVYQNYLELASDYWEGLSSLFLYISLPVLMDPPFEVVFGPFITSEDNLERVLYFQVWFLYFVFDLSCLQYSLQVVDGSIFCKRP